MSEIVLELPRNRVTRPLWDDRSDLHGLRNGKRNLPTPLQYCEGLTR